MKWGTLWQNFSLPCCTVLHRPRPALGHDLLYQAYEVPTERIMTGKRGWGTEKKDKFNMNIYKLDWARTLTAEGGGGQDTVHLGGAYTYHKKPKRLCKSSSRGRRLNSSSDTGPTQRSVWKTLSPTCMRHSITEAPMVTGLHKYIRQQQLLVFQTSRQPQCTRTDFI